jgi:hypothetical protein
MLLKVIILLISLIAIKTEVVCSEDELVREIIEDLEDNGILIYLCRKTRLFERIITSKTK